MKELTTTEKAITALTYCKEHGLRVFIDRVKDEELPYYYYGLFVEYQHKLNFKVRNFVTSFDAESDLEEALATLFDVYITNGKVEEDMKRGDF